MFKAIYLCLHDTELQAGCNVASSVNTHHLEPGVFIVIMLYDIFGMPTFIIYGAAATLVTKLIKFQFQVPESESRTISTKKISCIERMGYMEATVV